MSICKHNEQFKQISLHNNVLYNQYKNTLHNANGYYIQNILKDILETSYNLNMSEDINAAISKLSKLRSTTIKSSNTLRLRYVDYLKSYNTINASLSGLRIIELVRYGSSFEDIIKYERSMGNPDGRAIRSLLIAKLSLTETLYDIYKTRFKCESICKLCKLLIKILHRRRSLVQSAQSML